jgi:N,N'-diacetyllegionaminate synthase
VAAVALGADLYERHFVLAGDDGAIDRPVSSTPEELAAIVVAMHHTRVALGDGIKACRPSERPNRMPSRRGLYVARPLPAGHVLAAADLVALRPSHGLEPRALADLVGVPLSRAVAAGEALAGADLAIGDVA